jgi:DNA (cytosine-5)-methyltransferase 1
MANRMFCYTKPMKPAIKTYIDLFAGIGGFRLALDSLGLKCVYSNDYDLNSSVTYKENFGEIEVEDINKVKAESIPKFDLLCAGFPCQPFSIAGVSKKNSLGRKHGFDDIKQGNLFFEIIRIVKHHKPKVLFLENVKNLRSHDKGQTWQVIKKELEINGYKVFEKIVDGKYYVPQHRERIYIICFNKEYYPNIQFEHPPIPNKRQYELKEIIDNKVEAKYTLSDKLWLYLQNYKQKNIEKGNGFGFGLVDSKKDEYTRTISARYYKDGSEALIKQKNKNPRRLTPRECARLQGFPDDFKIVVSDTQAYHQFGNSVVMPAIKATAKQIIDTVVRYNKGGAREQTPSLF